MVSSDCLNRFRARRAARAALTARARMGVLLVAALLITGTAVARDTAAPTVPNYGRIVQPTGAAELPDPQLRYRVVFSVTKAGATPGEVSPSLEKVARMVNLLTSHGVRIQPGDLVAVVHGPAATSVLKDPAYVARVPDVGVSSNPNGPLVSALQRAGVVVSICGQAMHGQKIAAADLAPGVRVDLAALTTLANLQLRGYALINE